MEKISDDVTKGASKSAARAMLRAVGLKDDDFNKFQVGVVSAGNEVTPCNLTGPELSEYANRKEEISVSLKEEKIVYGNNEIKFKIDSFKKKCLLEGLDDIALSLNKSDKIKSFEQKLKSSKPWIISD